MLLEYYISCKSHLWMLTKFTWLSDKFISLKSFLWYSKFSYFLEIGSWILREGGFQICINWPLKQMCLTSNANEIIYNLEIKFNSCFPTLFSCICCLVCITYFYLFCIVICGYKYWVCRWVLLVNNNVSCSKLSSKCYLWNASSAGKIK